MPKSEIDRLVAGLARHPDVAVLSDEIYGEMVYEGTHVSLTTYPELADRLILLDGWSKTYAMTGWRLGYGVWPAALFPYAERLAINCHSCVNASAQYAGIAALTGPREPVARMVAAFAERRGLYRPGAERAARLPLRQRRAARSMRSRTSRRHGLRCAHPAIAAAGRGRRRHGFGHQLRRARRGHLRFSYAASLDALKEAVGRIGDWLGKQNTDARARAEA